MTMGVASDNVFYVVDPDGNLPETQTRLDKAFQDYRQWEGVAGVEPTKDVLERVLQDKDAYMFCGHGSGTKFLSGDEVCSVQPLKYLPLLKCWMKRWRSCECMQCRCFWAAAPANLLVMDAASILLALLRFVRSPKEKLYLGYFQKSARI